MKSAPRLNSDMVAEVMTQGRAVKSASFLFRYIEGGKNDSFYSFIASKKNFPTAVSRNKARRRGKVALHAVLKTNSSSKRVLGAFVLNKAVENLPIPSLSQEIEQILIKSGILVKP